MSKSKPKPKNGRVLVSLRATTYNILSKERERLKAKNGGTYSFDQLINMMWAKYEKGRK